MQAPKDIRSLLHDLFVHNAAYGQIATTAEDGVPSVRTVHIHAKPENNQIMVNANVHSEKWADIQHHPFISGCLWARDKAVQVRFKANAWLMSDTNKPDTHLLEHMWLRMRDEVRLAYHLNDLNIPLYTPSTDIDPTPRSPAHGVVIGDVFRWDVFWEGEESYRFGKRAIFTLQEDQTWAKKDVSSLHEQAILLYDGP